MTIARAALLVLVLSACGAPAGREFVPGGGAATAKAAPAASSAPAPGVETVTAAPGLKVTIEWPSERNVMVKAFTDSFVGQWRAVGTDGEDESYLEGVEEPANRDAYRWVRSFLAEKQSAQGTAKLYALRVASVTGRGAEINACVDTSGIRVTDAAGDPVADQPPWTAPPQSTYLQVAAVRRGDDGTWRVKLFRHASYPHERAKECLR
ncbi:hypothetical protein Aph01nite_02880 [Acrocarpospora phusangensis]|uniref:Lipoprotein n=1 Tax=Acrocarpospora phusangensis TaxID=1070424 RepID=A0A919UL53_9ACTN|nr:hypothetical protein [Acrocarpospora phusangensis]GIH21978.1 hypothetical protein Aph01nite_02880 [Acrocarpospora phusangensis]